MRPYTVVILYPQPDADHPDLEAGMSYTAFVEAEDARAARRLGQLQAWRKQPNEDRGKVDDWKVLVVFDGHHQPVSYGWSV